MENFIAISSRVRIARNIDGYHFPHKLADERAAELIGQFKSVADQFFAGSKFTPIEKLSLVNLHMLVEKRLVSRDFAGRSSGAALLTNKNETLSVMFNEEDHLRIQALSEGFDLDAPFETAYKADDTFAEAMKITYSPTYGYITCCPTNLGTGLRASVMLHLPALTRSKRLETLFDTVRRMGVEVRGMYGENSEISGEIYQVSNQVTLGPTEQEIISRMSEVINRIIQEENETRCTMQDNDIIKLKDTAWRAYGILANARILTKPELFHYISDIRLGAALGILPVSCEVLNKLLVICQPAHIINILGGEADKEERDTKRAEIVRKELS